MRSILVYADRSAAMNARLESALALARTNKGHVTALIDTPVTRFIAMDPMGSSYLAADALEQALADADALAGEIEAKLANEDVTFEIIRSEGEPVEAITSEAKLADVIVLSRSTGLAGAVALASGTPVLVVEDDKSLSAPPGAACIAWDGGNEAAHALRASTALLAGCGSVHVITVSEKPGGFPATDALRYLSRHGISAELHEVARTGSTEETIAAAVARLRGQVLVMGAYGKSRMREYFFGGVTRHFLESVEGPALLLAH